MFRPIFGRPSETSRPRTPARAPCKSVACLSSAVEPTQDTPKWLNLFLCKLLRRINGVGPSVQLLVGRQAGKRKDVNRLS